MGRLGTFSPRTSGVATITDPQLKFLTSLTHEMFDLSVKIVSDNPELAATVDNVDRPAAVAHLATMTKAAASDRITSLKGEILPTMRATLRQMTRNDATADQPAAPAVVELDTDALYVVDDAIVRLKVSGAGRLYALTLDTDTRRWNYAPGMVRSVTAAHRMTAEQAKAFGDTYAWCSRCGRDLTREESVTRGMGPVCYSKSVG